AHHQRQPGPSPEAGGQPGEYARRLGGRGRCPPSLVTRPIDGLSAEDPSDDGPLTARRFYESTSDLCAVELLHAAPVLVEPGEQLPHAAERERNASVCRAVIEVDRVAVSAESVAARERDVADVPLPLVRGLGTEDPRVATH